MYGFSVHVFKVITEWEIIGWAPPVDLLWVLLRVTGVSSADLQELLDLFPEMIHIADHR